MTEKTERDVVGEIDGRGDVYAGDRKLVEVHYSLVVTGDVTVLPPPDEPLGQKDVSGRIEPLEADEPGIDLAEVDGTLTLRLDDGRRLDFEVERPIPGGYYIEGMGGFKET